MENEPTVTSQAAAERDRKIDAAYQRYKDRRKWDHMMRET